MKSLARLFFLLFACRVLATADASPSAVIHAPGTYASPQGQTTLHVAQDGDWIIAKFSHRGADGRATSKEFRCEAAKPWAALFEDDFTLWFYRGGDAVVATTLVPREGEPLSFVTETRVVDLRSEAALLPEALRRFLARP